MTDFELTIRGCSFYDDEYVKQDGAWRIRRTGYKRVFEEIQPRGNVEGLQPHRVLVGDRRPQRAPGRLTGVPTAAEIHARSIIPVIDADGHGIEYLPWFRDLLRDEGGAAAVDAWNVVEHGATRDARPRRRHQARPRPVPRVVVGPAGREHATTGRPRCCPAPVRTARRARHRRRGLLSHVRAHGDGARRPATSAWPPPARSTRYYARGVRAVSRSARAGRDRADVRTRRGDRRARPRGPRTRTRGDDVHRARATTAPGRQPSPRRALAVDALGLDSAHDYDPLWQRFVDLGVTPTFHSTGMGWGSAHVADELHGESRRFVRGRGRGVVPVVVLRRRDAPLPDAAVRVLGRRRRRGPRRCARIWSATSKNVTVTQSLRYDPARLDRARTAHARRPVRNRRRACAPRRARRRAAHAERARRGPRRASTSSRECGARSPADIRAMFARAVLLRLRGRRPDVGARVRVRSTHGTRLPAMFASDLGHWDVPDARDGAARSVGAGRARPRDGRRLPRLHATTTRSRSGGPRPVRARCKLRDR